MSSVDNRCENSSELETPVSAEQDLILKKIDPSEIEDIMQYIKALNKAGVLETLKNYNPESDELKEGDIIRVGYDNKDREVIARGGKVMNGYNHLLHQKVQVICIEREDEGVKFLVELVMDETLQEDHSLKTWIFPENVLIIE